MDRDLKLDLHFDQQGRVLYIAIDRPRPAVCTFTEDDVAVRFDPEDRVVGWTIEMTERPESFFLPLEGSVELDNAGITKATEGLMLEFDPRSQEARFAWARGGRAISPVLTTVRVHRDVVTRLKPAA